MYKVVTAMYAGLSLFFGLMIVAIVCVKLAIQLQVCVVNMSWFCTQ